MKPGTRTAARLAGAAGALVFACVSGAGAAGPVDTLQLQVQALHASARHALLDLYALDSRLQAAQQRLSALQAQAASLQREDRLLQQQLSSTRQTLSVSRRELAINLQVLYKQGDVSPLAVVLGSESLNDAVTKLDTLSSIADQSRPSGSTARFSTSYVAGWCQMLGLGRVPSGRSVRSGPGRRGSAPARR